MIFKSHICPVYNATIFYVADCSQTRCREVIEKKLKITIGNWNITDQYQGFVQRFADPSFFVIWVKKKNDTVTLVHEISHLVDFIFDDRGIETKDTEVRAYYLSYLFGILNGVKK